MSRYKDKYFKFSMLNKPLNNSIEQKGYDKGYRAGYIAGEAHVIDTTFNMFAYTLTYKTGYSTKRIQQLLHDLYFNIDSYRTGQLNAEDYQAICEELSKKNLTLEEILKDIK